MDYRTNAYAPVKWTPTREERLSFRLVGHYCLFVNIETMLMIAVPLYGSIAIVVGIVYAICRCFQ